MKTCWMLGIAFWAICSITETRADTFDDASAAYAQGDHQKALILLRSLADEKNDMRAQTRMGQIYRDGEGVPQDYVEAAKWFHKAAEGYREAAKQSEAAAKASEQHAQPAHYQWDLRSVP